MTTQFKCLFFASFGNRGTENEVVAASKPRKKPPRGRNVASSATLQAIEKTSTQRGKTTSSDRKSHRRPTTTAKYETTSTTPAPPTTPDPGSGNSYFSIKILSW